MVTKEKEFIEIEFSARVVGGELFDSTKKEDAKTLGVEEKTLKPLIMSIGNGMVVSGLDKDLVGKETGVEYSIELEPNDSFGKRNPSLVQMVPISNFKEQNIFPQKGMQFSFDGRLAKIISVSGGRILVDFNNPLAGKKIVYNYKILRKVEDKKEKLDALQNFFFKKIYDSTIEGDSAKIKVEEKIMPVFELMKQRLQDISGINIVFEAIKEKE